MKFFNISYNDKDVMAEVYAISGRPFSFIERLKKGGTGTPRGVLEVAPAGITRKFDHIRSTRYCSLQEMQEGIMLCFNRRQETFAVPMNHKDIQFIGWNREKEQGSISLSLEIQTNDGDVYQIAYNKGYHQTIKKFLNKIPSQTN
jgi:hypothetical protein